MKFLKLSLTILAILLKDTLCIRKYKDTAEYRMQNENLAASFDANAMKGSLMDKYINEMSAREFKIGIEEVPGFLANDITKDQNNLEEVERKFVKRN